jgi:LmbE family N-acetylglucosaminyl deacetylase
VRAAELARTPRCYAATVSRQHFQNLTQDQAINVPGEDDDVDVGVDESLITTIVDVSSVIDRKRAAMAAHPSQIGEESFFLALDEDTFLRTWGTEWFIRLDSTPERTETWLFES